MKTRSPVLVLVLVVGFARTAHTQQGTGGSYAQLQQPPRGDDTAEDPSGLHRQLNAILIEEKVPGAAVVLATSDGPAFLATFGLAQPFTERTVEPTTPFSAGALSPLFVALTAARLATSEKEAEAIDAATHPHGAGEEDHTGRGASASWLERPLNPEELGLTNPFAAAAALRLDQLLEQTAGLEDLAPREELSAPATNTPLEEVLRLRSRPLRWPPGTRFAPSRASFTAAALQLEKWGHGSFAALAEAEVFRPLGLECTTFRPEAFADALATGQRGNQPYEARASLHWPAAGLVTCAKDLSSVLLALLGTFAGGELHGRPLLPEALLARVHAGTTLALPPGVHVSGLGTRAGVLDGHLGAGLGGAAEGSASSLVWFPAERRGYGVLLASESTPALARVSAAVRRFLLRESPRAAEAPRLLGADAKAAVERAAGVWVPVAPPTELRRALDALFGFALLRPAGEGALSASISLGPPGELWPTGPRAFRVAREPMPTWALIEAAGSSSSDELVTPSGTFSRAFGPWVFLRLVLLGAALLALVASLLFALVWVPRSALGRLPPGTNLRLRAFPALAALVLAEWLVLWARSPQPLGAKNLTTVLIALLGVLYGALALAGLLEALRRPSPPPVANGPAVAIHLEGAAPPPKSRPAPARSTRLVRAFCLATSLLAVFLAALLASYGLLGVRTWAL